MSFDVLQAHLESGDTAPADRQAVKAVIRAYTQARADQYGRYEVPLSDSNTNAVLAQYAFHLLTLLDGSFDAWARYRARLVSRNGGEVAP
jgi:hypothetical protein